jgi:hypothetical protein
VQTLDRCLALARGPVAEIACRREDRLEDERMLALRGRLEHLAHEDQEVAAKEGRLLVRRRTDSAPLPVGLVPGKKQVAIE